MFVAPTLRFYTDSTLVSTASAAHYSISWNPKNDETLLRHSFLFSTMLLVRIDRPGLLGSIENRLHVTQLNIFQY